MTGKKLLFVGGTGTISAACVRRALERGDEVTALHRGRSTARPLPAEAVELRADIRDPQSVREVLGDHEYDSVVEFFAFLPEHIRSDFELFGKRAGQYVFISSASAYQTPPQSLPVTEDTPLSNPFWQYSREKIACEEVLSELAESHGFPVTVVRPSHTYDRTSIPFDGGWTIVDRMRRGEAVVVPGDGTSLWTITHTDDVAVGLVGLLGNAAAVGEAFHITNSAPITWDHIFRAIGGAAGVADPVLAHVASESIAAVEPAWGPRLLGDVSHSMVFDNSKVAATVADFAPSIPFEQGAAEIVEWHDAHPEQQSIDPQVDATIDRILALHGRFSAAG